MTVNRPFAILLLAVSVCVCTGCKSSSVKITKTGDFSLRKLEQEGVAFAGFTALGGGEYAVADTASDRFVNQLQVVATNMSVVSLPKLRKRLGQAEHGRFNKFFSDHEIFAPDLLAFFRENEDLPRFAIWMNLTTDESDKRVNTRKDVSYRTVTDSEGNTQQVVDDVEYVTTARASRHVSMTASIYDVRTERRIWHAKASKGRSNSAVARSSFGYPRARPVTAPGAFEVLEPLLEELASCLTKP